MRKSYSVHRLKISLKFKGNMSTDRTKLLFEGFLQKRKDTMKIRWVTYWFRLQNTTLFFYTKKNGSALHLRGYYYIYTVQSVREVQQVSSKRFLFEIIMTNGKRKVLAAESAADRNEWIEHLWRAMRLSSCGASEPENSNTTNWYSQGDNATVSPPPQLLSSFTSPDHSHREEETSSPNLYEEVKEEPTYQNTADIFECLRHHDKG
ncbi:uncharacterized protein LOC117528152 isoform X2 [Thalassophryne amazonica]|uniref:uncharacterized protein LOC117528152 isoform X2 n=1 Tax=Thalassophryne amazonica TaxID=390379 RepID=UPI00147159DB|nr:uncharacterized protein LOC117528152 isoform X2 [Thalassophryne amazonica]